MFENPILDLFSRTHWTLVPVIYVPLVVLFVGIGSMQTPASVLVFQSLSGWFAWTFMEYWLHRTLFHWVPPYRWGARFHFFLHGVHHQWYKDRLRLVMPPAASLALGVLFFAGFHAAALTMAPFFNPDWVWGVFAGVMSGYLAYDLTHYYIHHGRPRTRWLKQLAAHHAKHHHNPQYAERKFGVSTTLWDHVFRTY